VLASPEITWALILGFALSAMVPAHPHEGHGGHAH